MRLVELKNKLLEVTEQTYHFVAPENILNQNTNYILWGETGADHAFSDNKVKLQTITGIIDYVTHDEFDNTFITIQNKLNELCTSNSGSFSWKLVKIDYIKEYQITYYEWTFGMVSDFG